MKRGRKGRKMTYGKRKEDERPEEEGGKRSRWRRGRR